MVDVCFMVGFLCCIFDFFWSLNPKNDFVGRDFNIHFKVVDIFALEKTSCRMSSNLLFIMGLLKGYRIWADRLPKPGSW